MSKRRIIASLRTGLAVTLSLFIGKYLGLDQVYWAPTTVLVVEGLSYGAVSEKLFKRLAGNLTGAVFGLIIFSFFIQSKILYATLTGCCVTLCTYMMIEGKNPFFWRWAIVAFCLIAHMSINNPLLAFNIGVERLTCVCLGLIAAALSHQLIMPKYSCDDYYKRLSELFDTLALLMEKKAGLTKSGQNRPIVIPGEIIAETIFLREEFRLACIDSHHIKKREDDHTEMINQVEDIANEIAYICSESTIINPDKSYKKAVINQLEQTSFKLRLLKLLFSGTKTEDIKKSENEFEQIRVNNNNAHEEEILHIIEKRADRILKLAYKIDTPLKEKMKKRATSRPKKEEDLIGGPLLSAWKSIIAGLAAFLGLILWRETGWPGGSSIPLIVMLEIQLCTKGSFLTISLFSFFELVALIIGGILVFFVFPFINSMEFFFLFILLLYTFMGWFMSSKKPQVRGLAMVTAIFVNTFAYKYQPSASGFIFVENFLGLILASYLLSWILLALFYPREPEKRFKKHADNFFRYLEIALKSETSKRTLYLQYAKRSSIHMVEWLKPVVSKLDKKEAWAVLMFSLSARGLTGVLKENSVKDLKSNKNGNAAENFISSMSKYSSLFSFARIRIPGYFLNL